MWCGPNVWCAFFGSFIACRGCRIEGVRLRPDGNAGSKLYVGRNGVNGIPVISPTTWMVWYFVCVTYGIRKCAIHFKLATQCKCWFCVHRMRNDARQVNKHCVSSGFRTHEKTERMNSNTTVSLWSNYGLCLSMTCVWPQCVHRLCCDCKLRLVDMQARTIMS